MNFGPPTWISLRIGDALDALIGLVDIKVGIVDSRRPRLKLILVFPTPPGPFTERDHNVGTLSSYAQASPFKASRAEMNKQNTKMSDRCYQFIEKDTDRFNWDFKAWNPIIILVIVVYTVKK